MKMHDRAITLLEVLVTITVISLLVAIALPAVARARQQARILKCQSNVRSAALAIQGYCGDFRDRFPYSGETRREIDAPGGKVEVGGAAGLSGGTWAALLPDYWSAQEWSQGLRCPGQPATVPRGTRAGILEVPYPDFWMSGACWLTPESLAEDHNQAESGPFVPVPRANSIADVWHPSKKTLLFEGITWCARGEEAEYWRRTIGQTPQFPASISMMDGSVTRLARMLGEPASSGWPLDLTRHGLHGVDIQAAAVPKPVSEMPALRHD